MTSYRCTWWTIVAHAIVAQAREIFVCCLVQWWVCLGRPIQVSLRWLRCPCRHSGPNRATRWADVWSTLSCSRSRSWIFLRFGTAEQEKETMGEVSPGQSSTACGKADGRSAQGFKKGPVELVFEFPEPQIVIQLVEVSKIVVKHAVSSVDGGSSWPGERNTTNALTAAVNKPSGEAGFLFCDRTVQYPDESEVEGSSGEAFFFLPWRGVREECCVSECSKHTRMKHGERWRNQNMPFVRHVCKKKIRNVVRSLCEDVQVFAQNWRTRASDRTITKGANGRSWYRWSAFSAGRNDVVQGAFWVAFVGHVLRDVLGNCTNRWNPRGVMSRGGNFERMDAGQQFCVEWRKHQTSEHSNQYRSESGGLRNPQTSAQLFGIDPSLHNDAEPGGVGSAQSAKASSMVLPMCPLKMYPCVPAQHAHVFQHVRVVPVHTGTIRMFTRARVEWTHSSGRVRVISSAHMGEITWPRDSPKNQHWISQLSSLRTGRERHVSDSSKSFAVPDEAVRLRLSWRTIWTSVSSRVSTSVCLSQTSFIIFIYQQKMSIYIYMCHHESSRTHFTTFETKLCGRKQATTQAHVRPHCVWLNTSKNSNRWKFSEATKIEFDSVTELSRKNEVVRIGSGPNGTRVQNRATSS